MKIILSFSIGAAVTIFAACGNTSQTKVAEKSNEAVVKTSESVAPKNDSVADAVKITVSKNGFEPSEIRVEKGKTAKIALTRIDEQNCASEVVFPKLNITKKLPVGETVSVEINPTESGEIAFACGMGMFQGKVLVQ